MTRRMLLSAVALLAGCGDDACQQGDVRMLDVGVTDRLNAVTLGYFFSGGQYPEGSAVIVGDAGVVLRTRDGEQFFASRPVAEDLYAVTFAPSSRVYVAGANGTLLRGLFGGDEWTPVAIETTADLWAVEYVAVDPGSDGAARRTYTVAVGDDVVVVRDPVDERWDVLPAPAGGWGALRTVFGGRQLHVAGRDGAWWSADDPGGPWTSFGLQPGVDLLDGGIGPSGEALIVGSAGSLLESTESGAWQPMAIAGAVDLIGFGGSSALAADGRVYDVSFPEEPITRAWSLPGARAIADAYDTVVVGEGGLAARVPAYCD